MKKRFEMIVVGTSSGGVTAVQQLLKNLDDKLSMPIVVVQHLPDHSRVAPQTVYGNHTTRDLVEVIDKMPVADRTVFFAPPGYHLSIEAGKYFALSQEDKVNYSRPSIDVTFDSASDIFHKSLCAVLLTGANDDGAKAMARLSQEGAYTIVQDPESAEVDRMPTAALKLFSPDFVGNIEDIAHHLNNLVEGNK